jgi:hypothetical protein
MNEIGETCCAMKKGLLAQITAFQVDNRHITLHCMLVVTAQSCYVLHSQDDWLLQKAKDGGSSAPLFTQIYEHWMKEQPTDVEYVVGSDSACSFQKQNSCFMLALKTTNCVPPNC